MTEIFEYLLIWVWKVIQQWRDWQKKKRASKFNKNAMYEKSQKAKDSNVIELRL